nr:hypothetical protein [Tanacetum cinerariifolium]
SEPAEQEESEPFEQEESEPAKQEEPDHEASSHKTATAPPPLPTTVSPLPTHQGPYLRQTAQIRAANS